MKRLIYSILGIATCIFFGLCFLADYTNTDVDKQLDKFGVVESTTKTDSVVDTNGGGGNDTNTEVVELIKKEIQKLSKPKHLNYQEVLEQQKQNNPNAFKQQQ